MEDLALNPRVRRAAAAAACLGSGFFLSALGLGKHPQPVVMGLICSSFGWKALLMALGAIVGYPTFWAGAGNQGIVWSAAGGVLALMVGRKPESRRQPLMLPAVAAFLTVVTALGFRFLLDQPLSLVQIPLQAAAALFSGILFTQVFHSRDPLTDWLVAGVGVLAVAKIFLGPLLGLGYLASGFLAVGGAFPAAALAGAALDLSRVTRVPMTAVMCFAYFLRMIPYDRRWKQCAAPVVSYMAVSTLCGIWDPAPLAGMALGGAFGGVWKPQSAYRRGETGRAQVRLEQSARMLGDTRDLILDRKPPPISRETLMEKARQQACGGCPLVRSCSWQKNLPVQWLEDPREAQCRKPGRLVPELRRAKEQLRLLQADRKRQAEYQAALAQQYRFLGMYLRSLSDALPRRGAYPRAEFRIELSVRSQGKEEITADRCFAFPGSDCRYFVVLCDGMGTGLGAAREGQRGGKLLRQLLLAGFPAEHALQSLNSLLVLGGCAGALTADLAEISLESGIVHIYKWGAAPSWVLHRRGKEKIGTASPPPGLSVEERPMTVKKLSLRRGEVLMLLSDGVDPRKLPDAEGLAVDGPLGDLAERVLKQSGLAGEDDATAALIRLKPAVMPKS